MKGSKMNARDLFDLEGKVTGGTGC